MPPRLASLLASLNEADVRYVVIGALAFPAHGFSRVTDDVDILFEPTPENVLRLRAVLRKHGYPEWDATDEDFLTKKMLFRGFDPELDTHPSAKGVAWAEVWASRAVATVQGVAVPCASLDHLIAMKRAAGRPKDLQDLKALEELRRLRGETP